MKINEQEQMAIRNMIAAGELFGYGNMISHLQTAWARVLIRDEGMSETNARTASGGTGYPFLMQDDLLLSGEWDETGERYRSKKKARARR